MSTRKDEFFIAGVRFGSGDVVKAVSGHKVIALDNVSFAKIDAGIIAGRRRELPKLPHGFQCGVRLVRLQLQLGQLQAVVETVRKDAEQNTINLSSPSTIGNRVIIAGFNLQPLRSRQTAGELQTFLCFGLRLIVMPKKDIGARKHRVRQSESGVGFGRFLEEIPGRQIIVGAQLI